MFFIHLILFSLTFSSANFASGTRALFEPAELKEVERYKTDSYVIAGQIELWRSQQKGFFTEVLKNTSKEDLVLMRKQLPFVMEQMEKAEYAIWLANTLKTISQPPVITPKENK